MDVFEIINLQTLKRNHRFFFLLLSRYDEERDIPAVCRTSDINEELGLVTHLFADKTGKSTKNKISSTLNIKFLQFEFSTF